MGYTQQLREHDFFTVPFQNKYERGQIRTKILGTARQLNFKISTRTNNDETELEVTVHSRDRWENEVRRGGSSA